MTAIPEADVTSRRVIPRSTRQALGLIAGAVGIVFGDIGTSPLYTLQECVSGPHGVPPSRANVLGVVSLIVWAVTLVVSVKYVTFLMRADNRGEGGIMALLALVPERVQASDPTKLGAVALLVLAGAALMFGDGIITPAISVLSAIEGIEIVYPEAASLRRPDDGPDPRRALRDAAEGHGKHLEALRSHHADLVHDDRRSSVRRERSAIRRSSGRCRLTTESGSSWITASAGSRSSARSSSP